MDVTLISLISRLISLPSLHDYEVKFLDAKFYVGPEHEDIIKRLPQLHYIKMKIGYDPCFIDIRVTLAT